ncbi:hypothetical protein AAHE18_10G034000 [Arachis hypogaea]
MLPVLSSIPCKKAFVGCWKHCHRILPVAFSCSTRFPVFRSLAVVLDEILDTFVDQRMSSCEFSRTRFPSLDILSTPEEEEEEEESFIGWSLLATHTKGGLVMYQIPR